MKQEVRSVSQRTIRETIPDDQELLRCSLQRASLLNSSNLFADNCGPTRLSQQNHGSVCNSSCCMQKIKINTTLCWVEKTILLKNRVGIYGNVHITRYKFLFINSDKYLTEICAFNYVLLKLFISKSMIG